MSIRSISLFALLSVMLSAAAPGAEPEKPADARVWVIPVKGDIEPSLGTFVRREARNAVAKGADFIVFDIDTFGGRVDTALQISSFIGSIKEARTVAWVRSGPESLGVSWSAGALIALSCSEIYMAAGTSIGAAAPVTMGADGQPQATGEKTVSAVRSQMAALAEKNGHPAGIALAMVDQDVELWEITLAGETQVATVAELERLEKDKGAQVARISVVSPKGKLLSLTAGEAVRYGLAAGTADDLEALMAAIGAEGEVAESNPSAADQFVAFLTSGPVQALLILVGLVMLFLEINSPGFGVPGVVAIIAFLSVFGANALLGTVGSLELILFLIGVGLLAVEIFVLPGFGVAGVSGLVLIGFSLVFSMQDFVVPTLPWQWELLGRNLIVVAIGIILAITGIAAIILAGTRIKLFDRLTLKARIVGTAGGPDPGASAAAVLPPQAEDEENYGLLVGRRGTAATTLRPSGKAKIDGRILAVESDGAFIEPGAKVEVIRVRGNRIIVRSV